MGAGRQSTQDAGWAVLMRVLARGVGMGRHLGSSVLPPFPAISKTGPLSLGLLLRLNPGSTAMSHRGGVGREYNESSSRVLGSG